MLSVIEESPFYTVGYTDEWECCYAADLMGIHDPRFAKFYTMHYDRARSIGFIVANFTMPNMLPTWNMDPSNQYRLLRLLQEETAAGTIIFLRPIARVGCFTPVNEPENHDSLPPIITEVEVSIDNPLGAKRIKAIDFKELSRELARF